MVHSREAERGAGAQVTSSFLFSEEPSQQEGSFNIQGWSSLPS